MSKNDRTLNEGFELHRQGRLSEAALRYQQVIQKDPRNHPALHFLGVIKATQGLIADAKQLMERALSARPLPAGYVENYATLLVQTGEHDKAIQILNGLPAQVQRSETMHYVLAVCLYKVGRYDEAAAAFDRVLSVNPRNLAALNEKGAALAQLGRYDQALECVDAALALNRSYADAILNRANILQSLKRHDETISTFENAMKRGVNTAEIYSGYGSALRAIKKHTEAAAAYDKALSLKPGLRDALLGRANLLIDLGRHKDAVAAYERLLAADGSLTDAWLGLGIAEAELGHDDKALGHYGKAAALKPDLTQAWTGRGYVLRRLKRYDEAIAAYDKALAIDGASADAWQGRGNVLLEQKRYSEAFGALDRAFGLAPESRAVEGLRLHMKMHLCDWRDFDAERDHLIASVRAGKPSVDPFSLLGVSFSTADELACAALLSERFRHNENSSQKRHHDLQRRRIRVAYISADFREHAVAHLLAELFEKHDKSRFELFAIALCPQDGSAMQARLRSAFDHFIFTNQSSVDDIVGMVRAHEIDILVDLMGFTAGLSPRVVTARAAPIQVTYLSYPGLSGPCGIDYMIADCTVVPDADLALFDKAVVRLPNCYLPYDTRSDISGDLPAREREGLPERGFVFCCFNNTFKITPDVFRIWMQILGRVEDSVLWLASTNATAESNLRKEAADCGINPDRLRFAPFAPAHADHLARYRLADLFLDTLPFNAQTTACDALWAGTPVLTRIGASFCGRVAASILRALDLPELVTDSQDDYREMAIELASSPARLAAIKESLRRSHAASPFFRTAEYARHLESAYETMYERRREGAPAGHIDISP